MGTIGDNRGQSPPRPGAKGEKTRIKMEAPPGFEPGMEVLQTSALPLGDGAVGGMERYLRDDGAGNGIRTRDFDLGKVALYH